MATRETTEDKQVRDRAVRELTIALVATGITLVAAVGLYSLIPQLRAQLVDTDEEVHHKRDFIATAQGGEIVYRLPDGVENPSEVLERYETDITLLSRRFARGQFEMVALAGMTETDAYQNIADKAERFDYAIERRDETVALVIRARDRLATQALHAYLKYLEDNWVI